jgi:hypothetical protein
MTVGACELSMRWAYLNASAMTEAKKIIAAVKNNPATIFPLSATLRRAVGRRG